MKKYKDLEIDIVFLQDEVIRMSQSSGTEGGGPDLDENEMPFLPFG